MSAVTRWLERASPGAFGAYAVAASFGAYFAMYAFRKPFAVGVFEGDLVAQRAVDALDRWANGDDGRREEER